MIWSRSRPPPRGPLRISGDTRAATPSKNAQHARKSPILRSNSVSSIGSRSTPDGENEMPQKSVEPGPTRSRAAPGGPGDVDLAGPPRRDRDRAVSLAIRLERLERQLRGLRPAAPARPVDRERHRLVPLGATFHDGANGHRGG